jgi:hypothetical protein
MRRTGGDWPEVLGLPDGNVTAEVSREGVDAPIPGIRRDDPNLGYERSGQLPNHGLEVFASAAQATSPNLMDRKIDGRHTSPYPHHDVRHSPPEAECKPLLA